LPLPPQIERNYPRSLPERLYRQLIFPSSIPPVASNACSADGVSEIGRKTRPLNWFKRLSPHLAGDQLFRNSLDAFRDTLPPSSQLGRNATAWGNSLVQRLFFSKVNTATVRVLPMVVKW